MSSLVLLLAMVAPPTEPNSPLPIGSTRPPEDGGFYFVGGSSIATGTGSCLGSGWKFADGGTLEVARDSVTCRQLWFETETYRLAFFAGTSLGARQKWDLRRGLVAMFDLGMRASTASFVWYPMEYL